MAYKEKYPSELLSEAVEAIGTLPGVGRRSALRLALHLLRQPQENVHHFTEAIDRLRDEARYCKECRMISDDEICTICADRSRDHSAICVVESVRDVMSIENTGQYHGVYHHREYRAVPRCVSRARRHHFPDRRHRPVRSEHQ